MKKRAGGSPRALHLLWISLFLLGWMPLPLSSAEPPKTNQVLEVAERMRASFQGIEDYSSEVEQIYFKGGVEDERHRFKYFFKKPDKIRVDFISPHSGLNVFYRRGEKKATLQPFPSAPSLKFRISIDNSIIKTPTGQGIHQTDMIFFIDFLFRNLAQVRQKDSQFQEERDQVNFLFWGQDYVKGDVPERYRIFISAPNWFPIRIERYSSEGNPVEFSLIQNYVFNSHLDDRFFVP